MSGSLHALHQALDRDTAARQVLDMAQYCDALLQKVAKLEAENEGLKMQMENLEAKHQADLAQANTTTTSHAAKSVSASAKNRIHVVMEVLAELKTRTMSGQAQVEAVADMRARLAPEPGLQYRRRHSELIPETSTLLTSGRRMNSLFYRPPAGTQELHSPTRPQRPVYQSWHSMPALSELHSMPSETIATDWSLGEASDQSQTLQSVRWEEFKTEMRERIRRRDHDKSNVVVQGWKSGLPIPTPVSSYQECSFI